MWITSHAGCNSSTSSSDRGSYSSTSRYANFRAANCGSDAGGDC